jgi:hypothetical protein
MPTRSGAPHLFVDETKRSGYLVVAATVPSAELTTARRAIRSLLLRYEHLRAHEECLLSVPDAVAWCWSHRSGWRERVRGIVTDVIEVG